MSDILVFNNIYGSQECDYLIDMTKNIIPERVPPRYSSTFYLDLTKDFKYSLKNRLRENLKELKVDIPEFLLEPHITIAKYSEGESFDLHTDIPNLPNGFDFLLVTLLNDDFEGGELFFPRQNIFFKNKGETVMFPCNFMYPHTVLPVTQGSRYVLITKMRQLKSSKDYYDKDYYTLLDGE